MFCLLCNFCLSSWSSCGLDRWSSTLVSEIHAHKTHTSTDAHTEQACWTCCTTCKQALSLPPGVDPDHKSATSFVLRFVVLFTLLNASALRQSTWGYSLPSCRLAPGDVASHQQPLSRVWHFCFSGLRQVWRPKRNLISRICPFYLLLSCTLTWPKTNFIKQGEDDPPVLSQLRGFVVL